MLVYKNDLDCCPETVFKFNKSGKKVKKKNNLNLNNLVSNVVQYM